MSPFPVLLLQAFLLPGSLALSWSDRLKPNAMVHACSGGTLSLPWTINLSQGDTILDIQWFYSGRSQEMIAAVAHDNFLPVPTFGGRVSRTTNVGIDIENVNPLSNGNYSVEILAHVADSRDVVRLTRSVTVLITDGPATVDGQLYVRLDEEAAVIKDSQGQEQFYLVLRCGTFPRGYSPAQSVTWTVPEGANGPGSINDMENGSFVLKLPYNTPGGTYGCGLSPQDSCLRGLPAHASFLLDSTAARLTVLEARQRAMERKAATCCGNQTWQDHLKEEDAARSALESRLNVLSSENDAMKNQLHALTSTHNACSARLHALESHVTALQAEKDALAVKVQGLLDSNNNTNHHFPTTSLHDVVAQLSALKLDTAGLKDDVLSLGTDSNNAKAWFNTTNFAITVMRNELEIMKPEIGAMRSEVAYSKANSLRLEEWSQKKVGFHAEMFASASRQMLNSGDKWVLSYTHINDHGAYNTSNGVFTAPTTGLYCFMASMQVSGIRHQLGVDLQVHVGAHPETVSSAYLYSGDIDTGGGRGTVHAVTYLLRGQQAWLMTNGQTHVAAGSRTVFSGFLVHTEL